MSEEKQTVERSDEALQPGQTCYWIEDLFGCRRPNVWSGTVIRYGHRVQIRTRSGMIVEKEHTFVKGTLAEVRDAVHRYTERINWMADYAIIRALQKYSGGAER